MALWLISAVATINCGAGGSWFPSLVISQPYTTSLWSSLSSCGGFTLVMPTKKSRKIQDTHLFLRVQNKKVFLNGIPLQVGHYTLIPDQHNTVLIDGREYRGPLALYVGTQALQLRAHYVSDGGSPFEASRTNLQTLPHYCVRVLLDEMSADNATKKWKLGSAHGFIVIDAVSHSKKKYTEEDLFIGGKKDTICVNKSRYTGDSIYVTPQEGFALVDGVPYYGSFLIVREANRLLLINMVELEQYVYCVLRTESWPGWPLEVNKAFAIASRSYVMAQMKTARKKKLPYHVKNTNEHQTYQGVHNCLVRREAVDQTRGLFLAYNNEPVLAMFDSCCGGVIPAHIENFDFGKADYLRRPYACKHCKKSKMYAWQAEFECHELHRQLEKILDISHVKGVNIAQKDKAGLVTKVDVKTNKQIGSVTGQQFYRMFKEVKSFCFDLKKKSNKIVLNGRGLGHHLGLCQWGAREMVRDGWSYRRILEFYYPGTQFLRLPT